MVRPLDLLPLLFLVGCGGKQQLPEAADAASEGATEASVDAPVDTGDPVACEAEVTRFAARLSAGGGCTTVVRVSQIDRRLLGVSVECGPLRPSTEAEARAALSPYAETYAPIKDYTLVGGGSGGVPWVFHHSPGDFGGVAIAASHTGMAAFLGSLSWSALGAVRYPATWATAPLSVCKAEGRPAYSVLAPGGAAPATDAAAADAVARAGIFQGITRVQGILGTTLVNYPRDGSYGEPGAPPQNEWVVVVQSAPVR